MGNISIILFATSVFPYPFDKLKVQIKLKVQLNIVRCVYAEKSELELEEQFCSFLVSYFHNLILGFCILCVCKLVYEGARLWTPSYTNL
jgi:hypothetical protein